MINNTKPKFTPQVGNLENMASKYVNEVKKNDRNFIRLFSRLSQTLRTDQKKTQDELDSKFSDNIIQNNERLFDYLLTNNVETGDQILEYLDIKVDSKTDDKYIDNITDDIKKKVATRLEKILSKYKKDNKVEQNSNKNTINDDSYYNSVLSLFKKFKKKKLNQQTIGKNVKDIFGLININSINGRKNIVGNIDKQKSKINSNNIKDNGSNLIKQNMSIGGTENKSNKIDIRQSKFFKSFKSIGTGLGKTFKSVKLSISGLATGVLGMFGGVRKMLSLGFDSIMKLLKKPLVKRLMLFLFSPVGGFLLGYVAGKIYDKIVEPTIDYFKDKKGKINKFVDTICEKSKKVKLLMQKQLYSGLSHFMNFVAWIDPTNLALQWTKFKVKLLKPFVNFVKYSFESYVESLAADAGAGIGSGIGWLIGTVIPIPGGAAIGQSLGALLGGMSAASMAEGFFNRKNIQGLTDEHNQETNEKIDLMNMYSSRYISQQQNSLIKQNLERGVYNGDEESIKKANMKLSSSSVINGNSTLKNERKGEKTNLTMDDRNDEILRLRDVVGKELEEAYDQRVQKDLTKITDEAYNTRLPFVDAETGELKYEKCKVFKDKGLNPYRLKFLRAFFINMMIDNYLKGGMTYDDLIKWLSEQQRDDGTLFIDDEILNKRIKSNHKLDKNDAGITVQQYIYGNNLAMTLETFNDGAKYSEPRRYMSEKRIKIANEQEKYKQKFHDPFGYNISLDGMDINGVKSVREHQSVKIVDAGDVKKLASSAYDATDASIQEDGKIINEFINNNFSMIVGEAITELEKDQSEQIKVRGSIYRFLVSHRKDVIRLLNGSIQSITLESRQINGINGLIEYLHDLFITRDFATKDFERVDVDQNGNVVKEGKKGKEENSSFQQRAAMYERMATEVQDKMDKMDAENRHNLETSAEVESKQQTVGDKVKQVGQQFHSTTIKIKEETKKINEQLQKYRQDLLKRKEEIVQIRRENPDAGIQKDAL